MLMKAPDRAERSAIFSPWGRHQGAIERIVSKQRRLHRVVGPIHRPEEATSPKQGSAIRDSEPARSLGESAIMGEKERQFAAWAEFARALLGRQRANQRELHWERRWERVMTPVS